MIETDYDDISTISRRSKYDDQCSSPLGIQSPIQYTCLLYVKDLGTYKCLVAGEEYQFEVVGEDVDMDYLESGSYRVALRFGLVIIHVLYYHFLI